MKTPARFFPIALGLLTALIATFALPLQADDEVDLKALIEELRKLKAAATENNEQRNEDIIAELLAAASSERKAKELYVKAVKMVQFERAEKRSSDFRDWEDNRGTERNLDSEEYGVALRLQLRWLAISLRAATERDIGKLTGPMYEYMEDFFKGDKIISEARDPRAARRLINEPVDQSVFAKAFRLEETLKLQKENWEMVPSRIDSIFEKNILPFFRAMDDVDPLETAWNTRISAEKNRAEERETAEAKRQFTEVVYPRLLWERDIDLYKVERTNSRLSGLVSHIKKHILHAEAGKWIDDLTEVLEGDTSA
ncbi:MAG: hypothetical protein AAGA58_13990 [Verrucomicrobiota bacterium]